MTLLALALVAALLPACLANVSANSTTHGDANCSFYMNTDFFGSDLQVPGAGADFKVISDYRNRPNRTMNEQDCCNICAGFEGCHGFTYMGNYGCYLKNVNAKSGATPATGSISGLVLKNADK
jgi:hypothetical protein